MRVGVDVSPLNRSAVHFRCEAEVDSGFVEVTERHIAK